MNVFELVAKITLDSSDLEQNLGKQGNNLANFGNKMKKGLATAAKVGAAALGAVSVAAVKIGKDALDAYANYEQLVGGVETLFGAGGQSIEEYAASVGKTVGEVAGEYGKLKNAEKSVLENAANAFRTAGLSANEYMERVTSFSASLLPSLGGDTEAAAKYADMAIIDMSDNANKMGTSMEAIQNAYNGFAKGQYQLLDNLKLGYGGTKSEMERLIQDAEKLDSSFKATRDENGDLAMSYADVVDAIHIVQDEMGITGTTAREASSTISGSLASAKAAWQNLLVGIADDSADFGSLIDNFVDSIMTVGENIIPRVRTIMGGLSKMIMSMTQSLFPVLIDVIVENLPMLIEAGTNLIVALISGLVAATPQLVKAIPKIVKAIVKALKGNWPQIKKAGKELIRVMGDGVSGASDLLKSVLSKILTTIKKLISDAWNKVKADTSSRWNSIKSAISSVLNSIKNTISTVWKSIVTAITTTMNNIQAAMANAWNSIKATASTAWGAIKSAITTPIENAKSSLSSAVESIKSALSSAWDSVKSTASTAWAGVKSAIVKPIEEAKESVSKIWDTIKSWFNGDIQLKFKLPSISLGEKVWKTAFGEIKVPWPNIQWNKIAMDNPMLFSGATIFGAGEAGDEVLYGRHSLMKDIKTAVKDVSNTTINITINAAPGMNTDELARAVERRLVAMQKRRNAVYA